MTPLTHTTTAQGISLGVLQPCVPRSTPLAPVMIRAPLLNLDVWNTMNARSTEWGRAEAVPPPVPVGMASIVAAQETSA